MNHIKISTSKTRLIPIAAGVFLLCLCAGIISGNYLKNHTKEADAASANVTVTNNNQVVTEDQGTPTITKTSTVTIKDGAATLGYTLSAQISQNTIPSSTVTIHSTTSTTCTQSSPCTLNPSTPTQILETTNTSATEPQGHTTDWTVTITLPTNTPQGNYLLDIAYSEDPILPPPPLQNGDNMQDVTRGHCESTALGTTVNLKDSRDNKYYRIKKMVDGRCWMIDDLAYDINTAPAQGKPAYSPTAQLASSPTNSVDTRAQYIQNNNVVGQGQIPNNGNPTPSYLYNWCAAMGDTSTNCAATRAYVSGQPNNPQLGICPGMANGSGFRLPIGGAAPSTPSNGSNQAAAAATTANEFAKLDIWMGGTGLNGENANIYNKWVSTGAAADNWSGVLNGSYIFGGMYDHGSAGNWWSSTASFDMVSYYLVLTSNNGIYSSGGDDSNSLYKSTGFAVRCVL